MLLTPLFDSLPPVFSGCFVGSAVGDGDLVGFGVSVGLGVAVGFTVCLGVGVGGAPYSTNSANIKPYVPSYLTFSQSPDFPTTVNTAFSFSSSIIL